MIASPCIDICTMQNGLCQGCLRTLEEIAGWGAASETEKQRILAAIAQRRQNSPR